MRILRLTTCAALIPLAAVAVAGTAAPAAGQSRSGASMAIVTAPGRSTEPVVVSSYAIVGLPNGGVAASDGTTGLGLKASGGPTVRFTTVGRKGPTVAVLDSAAERHTPVARVALDGIVVGPHTIHVVLANCSVVGWRDSASGRTGTLDCTQLISPSPTSQPSGGATYNLPTNHSGR